MSVGDLRTLESFPFSRIHEAFILGFSGYAVPMTPSEDDLREMLRRRGWRPDLSVGFFEDDAIVAFVLNGVGTLRGQPWAYNSGTGVVPSHRRRGLAEKMMGHSAEILRAAGLQHYVLEVLDANEPAIALYERCGFVKARRLQCWTTTTVTGAKTDCDIEEREHLESAVAESMWDFAPSWQNSHESIQRSAMPHRLLVATGKGETAGYLIYFCDRPELSQLAVHPDYRRRGIGRALLARATETGQPMRILNLETANVGMARFLENVGATRTVGQFEMTYTL